MFTTFPTLFSEIYGWGPGVSGLAYLGPGVGFFVAAMAGGRLMSKVYEVVSLFLIFKPSVGVEGLVPR